MNRIDFVFLDSGTGGVPYMQMLKQREPNARCAYLGDTVHFPYGEKTPKKVTECAKAAIELIIKKWNPKVVVIACNTISVTALSQLRTLFPALPLIGTVPAIKLAAKVTKNKKIGLLATNATVQHPYCQKLIEDFASDCSVFSRGDPDLIAFIEHNLFTATEEDKIKAVTPALDFFKQNDCDTIILGCTHFTHVADVFARAAGSSIRIIDSRDGVSNQALKIESEASDSDQLANGSYSDDVPDMSFFVTSATKEEEFEYKEMCKNFGIPWGGIISLQ